MAPRKLTPGEIKSVVEKIRKRYDEYIVKYFRPKTLREAFEDRYIKALRGSVDISSFLLAEIGAIEELIKREEDKAAVVPPKPRDEKPKPGIADKVLEENRKRIEKYPDVAFHKDAGMEVRKLLGALGVLEDKHWQDLNVALRSTAYSMNSPEMLSIDSRLHFLGAPDKDGVPGFLVGHLAQLKKFPRNYAVIDRAEKEYILESAFFLNDLMVILERVRRMYVDLGENEKNSLDAAMEYVWSVITDFRLKEFRKKQQ